jgi:hypothetical protein
MAYVGVKPAAITSATEAEIAGDLTVDTSTLKVDATNNRVGIGTTSATGKLDVEDTTGSLSATKDVTAEFMRNDGTYGPRLQIRHSTEGSDIHHTYSTGADDITLSIANGEKLRIQSGGGISFNGDTAAANALDDYEEGSWTPSIGGNASYDVQSGVYTKIGRMVFVWLYVAINTKGTGSGNLISGLPFNPGTSNQHAGVAYYNGILQNTYEFHLNFRSDGTIRSELKTSFGTGQSSGGSWTKDGATCIASGWYYT